jgi:hypothetical protein
MVVHQNETVQPHLKTLDHLGQKLAEMLTVTVILVDRTPFIAAGGNVIPSAWMLYPNWSRHFRERTRAPPFNQLLKVKM